MSSARQRIDEKHASGVCKKVIICKTISNEYVAENRVAIWRLKRPNQPNWAELLLYVQIVERNISFGPLFQLEAPGCSPCLNVVKGIGFYINVYYCLSIAPATPIIQGTLYTSSKRWQISNKCPKGVDCCSFPQLLYYFICDCYCIRYIIVQPNIKAIFSRAVLKKRH